MYKIAYISPEIHAKLVVLKNLGLIKSISGFVEKATNQAIKGIEDNNKGEKRKMKEKELEEKIIKKYTGMGFKPVYDDEDELAYFILELV